MPLKELHGSFVFLGRSFRLKSAEIPSLPSLRILLPRVQPIFTRLKPSDHNDFSTERRTPTQTLPSRSSTLNVFRSTLAGPLVTFPVRTSKHELCHGHCTSKPLKSPLRVDRSGGCKIPERHKKFRPVSRLRLPGRQFPRAMFLDRQRSPLRGPERDDLLAVFTCC